MSRDPTYSQAVSQSMIDSGERARGHQFIGVMIQVVRYEDSSSGRYVFGVETDREVIWEMRDRGT